MWSRNLKARWTELDTAHQKDLTRHGNGECVRYAVVQPLTPTTRTADHIREEPPSLAVLLSLVLL